uniref:Uncharacterized protein n=1 Tax=Setaria digitata TaxID=48799 RepID=A0A915Q2C5_9BILA
MDVKFRLIKEVLDCDDDDLGLSSSLLKLLLSHSVGDRSGFQKGQDFVPGVEEIYTK